MKRLLAALIALASFAALRPATAEVLQLEPRYRPGDAYSLSLDLRTDTDAVSGGRTGAFREGRELHYSATVVVLEADAEGRPVRERHEGARLVSERADDSRSLFQEGASLEVRRGPGGDVRVFSAGERVDRRVEAVVAEVLESQFEHTLAPSLFSPGRPVETGDSWELDRSLARRFLRQRGIRVVELGDSPTATLERRGAGDDGELVIRFVIPIAWFELGSMPVNTRATRSDARFEGTIRLSSDPHRRPAVYSANLAMAMDGVVTAPGLAKAIPWTLESSKRSDQRTLRMASRDLADAARY